MKWNSVAAIVASFLLTSCAGVNFTQHLDASIKSDAISELARAKTYRVVEASTMEINYSYRELVPYTAQFLAENLKRANLGLQPVAVEMDNYNTYIASKAAVIDPATMKIIEKRLQSVGMRSADEPQGNNTLLLGYQELMGWDMGTIVKEMRICGRLSSAVDNSVDCVEFSELKFVNSHPTRGLVVNNLLAILLTTKWPKEAPTDKYRKFRVGKLEQH